MRGAGDVVDALGRPVVTPRAPVRIVSLVPSETESAIALAGAARVVGRTEYCVEPAASVAAIPTVGGTKSVDVDAVLALAPDLVLANQEENARGPIQKLVDAGLTVHVSFPCTVLEALDYLRALATLLHTDPDAAPIRAVENAIRAQTRQAPLRALEAGVRVFVPIWKEPWMTFDAHTFASDLLSLVGAENVFADRARRYPLAADVGDAAALDADAVGERDTRYPRVTLDEVRARGAALALLPDEPYAFGPGDADALVDGGVVSRSTCVDGKHLFVRHPSRHAIPELARVVHG